jgi:hypothetical protein
MPRPRPPQPPTMIDPPRQARLPPIPPPPTSLPSPQLPLASNRLSQSCKVASQQLLSCRMPQHPPPPSITLLENIRLQRCRQPADLQIWSGPATTSLVGLSGGSQAAPSLSDQWQRVSGGAGGRVGSPPPPPPPHTHTHLKSTYNRTLSSAVFPLHRNFR